MFHNRSLASARRTLFTLLLSGFWASFAIAQEADPKALLKRMSDEIAGLESYSISGDAYVDARLDAGLIIEHASQATLKVRKPDTVQITNSTSEDVKELYFEAGLFTVYTRSRNFYGQTEIPGDAKSALDYAVSELGIDAPMLDFVSGEVAERLLATATEVEHLGTSLIRGKIYEHVAIRTPEVDIQLWIAAEGPPLPGKMALSAKWDGGAPRTVVFLEWDTDPDFPEHALKFEPPEGAIRISFDSNIGSED